MEVKNRKWNVSATIGNRKFSNQTKPVIKEEKPNITLGEIASNVVSSVTGPFTLFEAFDLFIEDEKIKGNLSASTIRNYENIRDLHLPDLMDMMLMTITEADVQKAFDREISEGRTIKTVKNYRSLLNKVLSVYRPDFKPVINL